jgi:hypothetical protein
MSDVRRFFKSHRSHAFAASRSVGPATIPTASPPDATCAHNEDGSAEKRNRYVLEHLGDEGDFGLAKLARDELSGMFKLGKNLSGEVVVWRREGCDFDGECWLMDKDSAAFLRALSTIVAPQIQTLILDAPVRMRTKLYEAVNKLYNTVGKRAVLSEFLGLYEH